MPTGCELRHERARRPEIERALCPVLIGREKELSMLEDALLASHRGEGQVIVLAGEAGLGKTRLATQLQKRALKGGTVVLWGGCSEAELALPYLPFLEAIGNYLASADVEHVRQRLGTVRRELAQLFPQLETESISHDPGDPTQGKLRLFEAILGLLRIPADEHGLLVVLEDLHWSDASTRELLDYLTRRLRNTRIMVLATYRSDELHRKHPLLPMVQGWRRTQAAQVVELEPLPAAQVASMVSAIFDGETVGAEFRDFMRERSEGNPFVIEELLKAALDRGDIFRSGAGWDRKALSELKLPPTVRDTILMRVERLGPEQADILRTAAVLGPSFAYRTLVAVSGRDEEVVQAALHACVQQQLMQEDPQTPGRYSFRHALTREAIYEDMITPKREKLHLRAAEVLREQAGTAPVDLAYHLIAANRWDEAVPMAVKAAEDAERRRGYREAAELYARALSHVTDDLNRGQLLCRQGDAYFLGGDFARAQPHLEEGIRLLESQGKVAEAARFRLSLGRCHWLRSQPALARAEYERALSALEPAGPSEDLAIAYIRLAGMHLFDMQAADCLAMAQRARTVAESAGSDAARIWSDNFIGSALVGMGRVDEGLVVLDRSFTEAVDGGHDLIAANAANNATACRVWNFRASQALPMVRRLRQLHLGGQQDMTAARLEGHIYIQMGELEKARQAFEEGLELARQSDATWFARGCERGLAEVYAGLGRFEEAIRLLHEPATRLERQDRMWQLGLTISVYLAAGDLAEAVKQAKTAFNAIDWPAFKDEQNTWVVEVAVGGLLAGNEISEAERIVLSVAAHSSNPGHPYRLRAEGRLALAKGDLSRAVERLTAAAIFFEKAVYRTEEWQTRRTLADAKARSGDRAGAESELRQVLAGAAEYGHRFEAESARRQLRELGIAVSDGAPGAVQADVKTVGERLVTVMFVDVRGYTAMTGKEAPHEMADRISTFYRWAQQEIERHHGRATQHSGDSVMATFNISGVRLDHTLHALQAAIAIRDKAAYAGLPVGVGLAVGAAIVGQLSEATEPTAIGETPNLASRLQANAAAGEILLSEEAFRRVREWLAEQNLSAEKEQITLKGFAEPVSAHRLRAAASAGA